MADPRPAYVPTAQEIALRAWVLYVCETEFSLTDVIYRNQRGPRPPAPYADIQVVTEQPDGEGIERVTDTVGGGGDYETTLTQGYHGTVSVNAFGPTARQIVRALVESIERSDVKEVNRNACCNVISCAGVPNDVVLLDTDWEQRAIADFRYSFGTRREYEVPGVEEIVITVKAETPNGDYVESEFTVTE